MCCKFPIVSVFRLYVLALQVKQIFLKAFEQKIDEVNKLYDSLDQNDREELQNLEKQIRVSLLF